MNQIPTVRVCELGKIKTSTVELGPKGKQGIPGPPGPPGSGTVFSAVASVDLKAGQAVYANGLGQLALATATIYGTTKVLGLVVADTATGFVADVTASVLTLTDWTPVTGASTLTAGAQYYLDLTVGSLSTVAPSSTGQALVFVGKAISTTTIEVSVSFPILL